MPSTTKPYTAADQPLLRPIAKELAAAEREAIQTLREDIASAERRFRENHVRSLAFSARNKISRYLQIST